MKNQREYLIEKVVIGQRLALARCRHSFMKAKEKCFVKLHHHKHAHMKAEFHGKVTGQLDGIEKHK